MRYDDLERVEHFGHPSLHTHTRVFSCRSLMSSPERGDGTFEKARATTRRWRAETATAMTLALREVDASTIGRNSGCSSSVSSTEPRQSAHVEHSTHTWEPYRCARPRALARRLP